MQRDDPQDGVDPDRTIAIPRPGGRLPPRDAIAIASAPPTLIDTTAIASRDGIASASGFNPLVAAANPLLNLVSRLRTTSVHRDPPLLRHELAQHIHEFEARAAASGISERKIIAARYLLCKIGRAHV